MCQSRHYHTGVADDPSMDLRPSVLIDVQKTVSNRQEAAPAAESLRSASLLSGAAAAPALTCRGWQPLAEARYGPSTDQPPRPPSDASERPLLAHVPTSGGKRVERKMTPHPYQVLRWWLSSPSAQRFSLLGSKDHGRSLRSIMHAGILNRAAGLAGWLWLIWQHQNVS